MIRRRLHALGALVIAGAALVALAGPAGAQSGERIDLVSQTLYVTDEPVVIDLRIPNLAAGRQLQVRVFRPVEDASSIRTAIDAPPVVGADLANFVIDELDAIAGGAGDLFSITLPDDEIGEILRREPGAIPIRVDLVDPDAVVLDTLITFVIVEDTTLSARIDIGFVADGRSPLAHGVDGLTIDPAAAVQAVADAVADAPGPTLVEFTPETLSALADPDTDGGLSAIDEIRDVLDQHLLSVSPWVSIDEEGWRLAGETERVFDLYALGQRTTEEFLGRTPTGLVRLDSDSTAETVGFLRSIGVTGGVIEATQLDPLTVDRADRRPIGVLDTNGIAMPVLVIDRDFAASLVGDDPELIAHHRFTELLFDAKTVGTDRSILLDLDTVDRSALTLLLDLIDTTDRLGVASIDELIARPPARDAAGAVLRVELQADVPDELAGAASDLRLTESVLASYTGMVPAVDGPVELLRTTLTAAMSDELDPGERQAYTNAVFDLVADAIADFEVVESSRVTLATRSATLPVSIRNDQTLPINVIVRIASEKLRFPEGEELALTLQPGVNDLEIPVETVASGDARIQISVTSPDGRLDLANGSVIIRSTAISGLGLVVSLISLAVLLTWWARTILRVRRARRAASVSDAASDSDTPPPSGEDPPADIPPSEEEFSS